MPLIELIATDQHTLQFLIVLDCMLMLSLSIYLLSAMFICVMFLILGVKREKRTAGQSKSTSTITSSTATIESSEAINLNLVKPAVRKKAWPLTEVNFLGRFFNDFAETVKQKDTMTAIQKYPDLRNFMLTKYTQGTFNEKAFKLHDYVKYQVSSRNKLNKKASQQSK